MSLFAWMSLIVTALGLTLSSRGMAFGDCVIFVLAGLVYAVLHVGWVLAAPQLREQRAAQRLAR